MAPSAFRKSFGTLCRCWSAFRRGLRKRLAGTSSPLPAETAAAVALVSDMGADSLRRLTAYLDAHVGQFEGLENCVPLVTTAAHALAAGDYARSFTLIFDVYRAIAVFRAEDPTLPLPASIKPAPMARGDNGESQSDASPPRPAH